MPAITPPVCQHCGLAVAGAYDARVRCARCQHHPWAFDRARAPFLYLGGIREAIHAFKYEKHWRIGAWLASRMAHIAKSDADMRAANLITAVPMHWVKQRVKGWNPAAALAQHVAAQVSIPFQAAALRRRRWTPTQTALTARQRARNVQNAFRASPRIAAQQSILLIDDVFTSGATAQACAHALREAGAAHVWVLTAACAPVPS